MLHRKINPLIIIYFVVIFLPLAMVVTILCATTAIIMIPIAGDSRWGYLPGRIWARLLMYLSLTKVKIDGNNNFDPDRSYVFVANHQSIYDIFLIYGWLNSKFRWIMKKELRLIPLVGYTCERMGHIFIDRSSPIRARQSLEKAKERLKNGGSIVLFPEGTRTRNGQVGRFKRGAVTIASELNMPIIPLTIKGAYEVLPRHSGYIKPGIITLYIHPAINATTVANTESHILLEQIRTTIAEKL